MTPLSLRIRFAATALVGLLVWGAARAQCDAPENCESCIAADTKCGWATSATCTARCVDTEVYADPLHAAAWRSVVTQKGARTCAGAEECVLIPSGSTLKDGDFERPQDGAWEEHNSALWAMICNRQCTTTQSTCAFSGEYWAWFDGQKEP
jgi:hypothetical protein